MAVEYSRGEKGLLFVPVFFPASRKLEQRFVMPGDKEFNRWGEVLLLGSALHFLQFSFAQATLSLTD